MVRRRRLLRTGGTLGVVAALSGCLGYEVVSSSDLDEKNDRITTLENDLEERETRVSDLSDKLAERNETIESLEGEIETLESDLETARQERDEAENTVGKLENQIESLETDLADARKGKIYDFYYSANELMLAGDDDYNTALDYYDQDSYGTAADLLFQAAMFYDSGRYLFRRAADFASEFGLSVTSSVAEEAQSAAYNWLWVSTYYGRASNHYDHDQYNAGDADLDEGDTYYNQAQNYAVSDPAAFADTMDYNP